MVKDFSLFLISLLCLFINTANAENTLNEIEALEIATEAYIYGYPLVTMEMTRKANNTPMGQFTHLREYPNPNLKNVTASNSDTLYSIAWLDLSKEPYVLHLPEENDRYYSMSLLSGWTEVFAAPGKRTTGTDEQNFAIVGPFWKGNLPRKIKYSVIKSPTNLVWIIGKTYCTGTPKDYKAVHKIQDEYKLIPLSFYKKKSYTPPKSDAVSIEIKTPVRDQVNAMNANMFFNTLALLMKDNPPAKEDGQVVKRLAQIGIIPGKTFDMTQFSPDVAKSIDQAIKVVQEKIMAQEQTIEKNKNGWIFTAKTGKYGINYLQRAFVAAIGVGANLPEDAVYPTTTVDSMGKRLNGANNYIMHFPKDQLPPVKGFWSLTMYNDQYSFVENPLNRYSLSPRNNLKMNEDETVDLYIQRESPGKDKESNWLPAPIDDFILMMRLYWPDAEVINGKWTLPAVEVQ